jgi:hypothetical protein
LNTAAEGEENIIVAAGATPDETESNIGIEETERADTTSVPIIIASMLVI